MFEIKGFSIEEREEDIVSLTNEVYRGFGLEAMDQFPHNHRQLVARTVATTVLNVSEMLSTPLPSFSVGNSANKNELMAMQFKRSSEINAELKINPNYLRKILNLMKFSFGQLNNFVVH